MTAGSDQGAIAQLGERLLCKQEVVGSIPSGSTSLAALARGWEKRSACRSFRVRRRLGEEGRVLFLHREEKVCSSAALAGSASHTDSQT
jgi:hypothetical protein